MLFRHAQKHARPSAGPQDSQEPAITFLLQELSIADEEFRRLRGEGQTRVNSFLTLAGTALGLVVTLATIKSIGSVTAERVSLVAFAVIGLIGTYTVVGLVVRDIETDVCARATGRIRHFFMTQYPQIAPYVTYQHTDAPTRWVTRPQSVSRRPVTFVTATFWGVAVGLLGQFAPALPEPVPAAAGALAAVLWWLGLQGWARARFRRAASTAARQQRFGLEDGPAARPPGADAQGTRR